jgi:hypothetical protein
MKFCIVQSSGLGCIFIRSSGKYQTDDLIHLIRTVGDLDLYDLGVPIIHDMRRVGFDVDIQDIETVGRTLPPRNGVRARKLAVIADTTPGFRALCHFADVRKGTHYNTMPFLSIPTALDWLGIEADGYEFPKEIEALMEGHVDPTATSSDDVRFVMLKHTHQTQQTLPRVVYSNEKPAYPAAATSAHFSR